MINGRRRDHGAERAHLHLFDVGRNKVANCQARLSTFLVSAHLSAPFSSPGAVLPAIPTPPPPALAQWRLQHELHNATCARVQPIAYLEFRDCFDYADAHGVALHPLHAQGYPSLGDVHSTLPVEREEWFEYGAERRGRFQGLQNKDGSDKTECGACRARSVRAWCLPCTRGCLLRQRRC